MILSFFEELFSNKLLLIAFVAWFSAQTIKFFLHILSARKIDPRILTSSGGLPSSHTALVCSMSVALGKVYGFHSPAFAAMTVVAFIIMYDAMGVRRSTGEQAKVLKDIVDLLDIQENNKRQIKEVLGHTPIEVFSGALLGILLGIFMPV